MNISEEPDGGKLHVRFREGYSKSLALLIRIFIAKGRDLDMSTQRKRILGRTGLELMPLGLGGMELHHLDQKQADILLNTALDNGVNYIDSSPEYLRSEERIGNAIAHRRAEFILATKCGDNMTGIGPSYMFDRKTCLQNLEDSLRQLKMDYIDVWQLHAVIPEYIANGEADDVIQCMLEAKKAGKIRFLGASIKNGRPDEDRHPAEFGYHAIKEFMEWKVLDVVQIVYGGLTRRNELRIQKAAEKGTGIVTRGILNKYKNNYDELFERSKISELFEANETRNEFLIRFALANKGVSCALIGTKSVEHLVQNIRAVEKGVLSQEVYNEAKRRLDAIGITPGPV